MAQDSNPGLSHLPKPPQLTSQLTSQLYSLLFKDLFLPQGWVPSLPLDFLDLYTDPAARQDHGGRCTGFEPATNSLKTEEGEVAMQLAES